MSVGPVGSNVFPSSPVQPEQSGASDAPPVHVSPPTIPTPAHAFNGGGPAVQKAQVIGGSIVLIRNRPRRETSPLNDGQPQNPIPRNSSWAMMGGSDSSPQTPTPAMENRTFSPQGEK